MSGEPVMVVRVAVEAPLTTGATPVGEARVIAFGPGTFEGPEVSGKLLLGGTDWQRVRADGGLEIRAHYMLESDRGEVIEVISEGVRTAAPEVLARLAAGEDVPPDEYYFRTFIRLNTASPRLARFNDRLYLGRGVRKARQVEITVTEVP